MIASGTVNPLQTIEIFKAKGIMDVIWHKISYVWKELKVMAQDTQDQVDVCKIDWRNDEATLEGMQGLQSMV